MSDEERLAAEQRARVLIDKQLDDAGWAVQDRSALNLYATQGGGRAHQRPHRAD